jgi:hypothetical protein
MTKRFIDNISNFTLVGNTMGEDGTQNVTMLCKNEEFFKNDATHCEWFKKGSFRVGIYSPKFNSSDEALALTVSHASVICDDIKDTSDKGDVKDYILNMGSDELQHPVIGISFLMLLGYEKQEAKDIIANLI